ncbi:MAG TPA: aquaporin [Gemmatimonadales bacterium]
MPSASRRFVAELLGTFALVFVGASASIAAVYPGSGVGLTGVALAHGFVLAIGVTMTMHISGGHLNPAVSLGLLVVRRIDARTFAVHLAAQLLAAVLAGLALKAAWPAALARVAAYGTPQLNLSVSVGQGILLEAIMGFFLMSAVFGTAVAAASHRVGGFGIGLSLVFLIIGLGPLTGAAVNLTRALGPAIASGTWTGQAVYWIGPALGAVVAAFVWDKVLLRGETTAV